MVSSIIAESSDEEINPFLNNEKKRKSLFRPRLTFAFIIVVLYYLAGAFGNFPKVQKIAQVLENHNGMSQDDSLREANTISGQLGFIASAGHFSTVQIISILSDRFGRKPFLLMALIAVGLNIANYIFIPPLWTLYFTSALSGLCDSLWTVTVLSILDVSKASGRAKGLSLLEVANGIGMAGPPLLAGLISTKLGYDRCFYVALILQALAIFFAAIFPDTNVNKKKGKMNCKELSPVTTVSVLFENFGVFLLSILLSLFLFTTMGLGSTFTAWFKYEFNGVRHESLDDFMLSTVVCVRGVGSIFSFFLLKLLVPIAGEKFTACTGVFLVSVLTACHFLVTTFKWQIIYPIVFFQAASGGLVVPTIQSYISKYFDKDGQTKIMGVLSVIKTIGASVATIIFPIAFSYGTQHNISLLHFYISTVIAFALFVVMLLFFLFSRVQPLEDWKIEQIERSSQRGSLLLPDDEESPFISKRNSLNGSSIN